MKAEISFLTLAFLGGMFAQKQMTPEEVEWKDFGENPMANPEFMKEWQASGTPGEAHAQLAKTAGEFTVDGKMWMGPGQDAMPTTATASRKMVLGGRYLIEEYKSDFMGMPFEGMLIQGYDNLHGENFSIWIDSMSTWPSISHGKWNDEGVLDLHGVMHDVMTPNGRPTRSTVTKGADGGGTMSMFDTLPDGGEFKVMELNYTRKK